MEYILMLCFLGEGYSYSCQALQLYSYSTQESCQKAANSFLQHEKKLEPEAFCIPVEAPMDER